MIELLGVEISQQALLVGLVTGLTYAAFAAGFVLIYRSTGVLNFAHGEMGAFGLAVFVLLLVNYDVNWWFAFVLAVAACALAGAVVELVVVPQYQVSEQISGTWAEIGVDGMRQAICTGFQFEDFLVNTLEFGYQCFDLHGPLFWIRACMIIGPRIV